MMRFQARLLAGFVGLSLIGVSFGAWGADAELEEAVAAFFAAERGEARLRASEKVLARSPSPEKLEALLKSGRRYGEDAPTGWSVLKNRAGDGKERPFHLLVPSDYDPARKYPLLVNMHGGVSRPALIPEESFRRYRDQMWAQDGRKGEYLLVLPLGERGAEWWNPNGLDNILGIVSHVKRRYNVDDNKIFATGFSDGASGSFFLAFAHTTPFAGFLSLNGFPPVAGAGGVPVYLPNASNKPMYVVNTTLDSLYPAKLVKPLIDAMRETGAKITYKVYENIGHRPDYWPQEREPCVGFIRETVRDPLPKTLTWETSSPEFGRCHWVRIDEVGEAGDDAKELLKDYNPLLKFDRIQIGILVDMAFEGEGVRIDRLSDGDTVAKAMGLRPGDVIVEMDGRVVGKLLDLRRYLGAKKPGDSVSLKILRGDEESAREGRFADPAPRPAFSRTKMAGRVTVACTGNAVEVRARNVVRFTLFISRDLFDLDEPLTVTANGRKVFDGFATPDVSFMITQAAEDDDRTMVFWGKVEVDLASKSEPEEGESEF